MLGKSLVLAILSLTAGTALAQSDAPVRPALVGLSKGINEPKEEPRRLSRGVYQFSSLRRETIDDGADTTEQWRRDTLLVTAKAASIGKPLVIRRKNTSRPAELRLWNGEELVVLDYADKGDGTLEIPGSYITDKTILVQVVAGDARANLFVDGDDQDLGSGDGICFNYKPVWAQLFNNTGYSMHVKMHRPGYCENNGLFAPNVVCYCDGTASGDVYPTPGGTLVCPSSGIRTCTSCVKFDGTLAAGEGREFRSDWTDGSIWGISLDGSFQVTSGPGPLGTDRFSLTFLNFTIGAPKAQGSINGGEVSNGFSEGESVTWTSLGYNYNVTRQEDVDCDAKLFTVNVYR